MHSNCADVKRILGVETCKESYEVYRLADEKIEITYSKEKCHKAFGEKWNVPIGTVTSVIIHFNTLKVKRKLGDFDIDLKKCSKKDVTTDAFQETEYNCKESGTKISLVEDDTEEIVTMVTYRPTTKDYSCLLCK